MSEFKVSSGATIPAARTKHATRYPWQVMKADDYFDVPLTSGDDRYRALRRIYASGRAWCKANDRPMKPVVRVIEEDGQRFVRCWLVAI